MAQDTSGFDMAQYERELDQLLAASGVDEAGRRLQRDKAGRDVYPTE